MSESLSTAKLEGELGEERPSSEFGVGDHIRQLRLEYRALREAVANHPEILEEFHKRRKALEKEAKDRYEAIQRELEETT